MDAEPAHPASQVTSTAQLIAMTSISASRIHQLDRPRAWPTGFSATEMIWPSSSHMAEPGPAQNSPDASSMNDRWRLAAVMTQE
ncbi:hypothetical protein, partial [Listeria seeligeri]|uniref:hypothetical protein n=1 Tax=Listeria seeligeri TaxID=1640 RepID=UPI0022EA301F